MIYQELLRDLTECYLKSLISEVSDSLSADFDSLAPFAELGIDSCYLLKIIGSARRGYFNYGRSKNIILVYGYTGPRDYLPALIDEMYQYCETNNFQLNILADDEVPSISGLAFSATSFGVLHRILNLKEFALE